ncbi:MAG: glycosyltransferase family 4 protein [Bacteroidales bacterium]|nr:glycosyltransferase family 4 protein [Bacteroidales bacterium]
MQKYDFSTIDVVTSMVQEHNRGLIVMAVSNDLLTDNRVLRHCTTLHNAGFDVSLIGRELDNPNLPQVDFNVDRLHLRHRRGWRFYAELNIKLFRTMRRMRPTIVWANDTDTLPACYATARATGAHLVFDAHELFPEVPELQGRWLVKRVWQTIERMLMPHATQCLTVCQSIADYYRGKLGVEMTVVRNLPNMQSVPSTPPSTTAHGAQLHRWAEWLADRDWFSMLYQGAVNKGRGVEWAIEATAMMPRCRLMVVGSGDEWAQMKQLADSSTAANRIVFTGRMMPEDLQWLTAHADCGLIMLHDIGLSYHFALPNRIGDMVKAAVPMVVSNLPEMANVVEKYGIGAVMSSQNADGLTTAVCRVQKEWGKANLAIRRQRFAKARAEMDWQREQQGLIAVANAAVDAPSKGDRCHKKYNRKQKKQR